MKSLIHRSTTFLRPLWAIAALAALLLVVLFIVVSRVSAQSPLQTQGGRLVTIHDRGEEIVVSTTGDTIADAIKQAGIEVDAIDAVEPAMTEKLVASEYSVNIYRARPVIVVDGATRQRVVTPYQSAQQIAKSVGITLYEEDAVDLQLTNDIVAEGAGLKLVIARATAFNWTLYGATTTGRTQAKTVGGMLEEKGITIKANDRVSPDQSTPISADLVVRVWREGKQTITVNENVDFAVEKIQDADRPVGYKAIKTAGEQGSRNVTYEITIQDGQETARNEIASIVTKEPKQQVEIIGVKLELTAGYSSERVSIMSAAGVPSADQGYAAYIIDNENALWCPIRWQGTRGCAASYYEKFAGAESSDQVGYGLCQATPGIKMATAGADWRTNVITQMKWCRDYALGRYGSWQAAYNFKVTRGWW
jgi:uncharacterized protein YabE (DUF348 family)